MLLGIILDIGKIHYRIIVNVDLQLNIYNLTFIYFLLTFDIRYLQYGK